MYKSDVKWISTLNLQFTKRINSVKVKFCVVYMVGPKFSSSRFPVSEISDSLVTDFCLSLANRVTQSLVNPSCVSSFIRQVQLPFFRPSGKNTYRHKPKFPDFFIAASLAAATLIMTILDNIFFVCDDFQRMQCL